MNQPIISLCLPTNGIIEWVFPVLDSIYSQNIEDDLFEVIVTNNGDNAEFHSRMLAYAEKHSNIIYKKTDAYLFENQLEALRLASGEYFKLINHRGIFLPNALGKMISVIKMNMKKKPVLYFSDGTLREERYVLDSFDSFVKTLGRYVSWTTGVGIWKQDYLNIPSNQSVDKISPHSCILFSERKKDEYIIENFRFAEDITNSHEKKGKYNLFKAFAVEELTIVLNLYIDEDISIDTLKAVKKDYARLISGFYWQFCIKGEPCSYDLSGFYDAMGVFYRKREIIWGAYIIGIKGLLGKIKRRILRGKYL